MKTAVSLPDKLYKDAEQTAHSMGIPRSQLFAIALEEFINHHKRDRITQKLNEIYKEETIEGTLILNDTSIDSMRELTKNDTW